MTGRHQKVRRISVVLISNAQIAPDVKFLNFANVACCLIYVLLTKVQKKYMLFKRKQLFIIRTVDSVPQKTCELALLKKKTY